MIIRKVLKVFEYLLSTAYMLGTVLNVLHIFYPNYMRQKLLSLHMTMTVICSQNIHIPFYTI